MSNVLSDPGAERAVLAGICRYGDNAYYDVADLLNDESFTIDSNKILFKCLSHIIDEENKTNKIDIPSIFSASNTLGLGHYFQQPNETEYLHAILNFPILLENVRKFAKITYRLLVGRTLHKQLKLTQDKLTQLTGEETVSNILSIAENTVFDFSALTQEDSESYIKLGDKVEEYLKEVCENPVAQIGLSSGYPRYDEAIGGGLRVGLAVIGARKKVGKSTFSMNVAHHVASKLKIPVLYLDTEMLETDQLPRWLGNVSSVKTNSIACGTFSQDPTDVAAIDKIKDGIKNASLFYRKISGIPFEEQLTIMRRWHKKEVGNGNRGLIIYDYFQLTDGKDLSSTVNEYQVLGFMMKKLNNFSVINEIPMLAMVQLNREYGISGSDRITWICTSFSKLLMKSDEEIADDGVDAGNRKLVIDATRHGEGLDNQDYINFQLYGAITRLEEKESKFELINNTRGFAINGQQQPQSQSQTF